MKFAIVLLALVASCMAACNVRDPRVKDEFESFKRQYRKAYTSEEEEALRCAIFAENYAKIETHNMAVSRNAAISWTLTINKFADYTTEEFIALYGGLNPDLQLIEDRSMVKRVFVADPNYKASLEQNWITKGKVSQIKNQARCGSCWAFATTAVMESNHAIKHNEILDLSEQQLVECASGTTYNNFGCNGGLPKRACDYLKASQGLNLEKDYPYISADGNNGTKCHFDATKRAIKILSYTEISKSDAALEQAIDTLGPVAVAVKAGHDSWQFYGGGLHCDNYFNSLSDKVDHAVVAVGYTKDEWIVKNSWGEGWGRAGYIHLCRSIKNHAGITGNNGLFPGLTGIAPLHIVVA